MAAAIDVIDGAVPNDLVETLDQIVRMPIWKHSIKSGAKDPFMFWYTGFANNEAELQMRSAELYALWRYIKPHVASDQEIQCAYANGQTYGQPGSIHTDNKDPGHRTVVYYCNSYWQTDWHGETMFYTHDHSDVIRAVLPKPGRVVIFDADIPHAARDPSRLCSVMRVTVTFKLGLRGSQPSA
jgi:SM-20-related protein